MNHRLRQVLNKQYILLDTNGGQVSFQNKNEIISLEVIATRKVSIFQLFPSDCITLQLVFCISNIALDINCLDIFEGKFFQIRVFMFDFLRNNS